MRGGSFDVVASRSWRDAAATQNPAHDGPHQPGATGKTIRTSADDMKAEANERPAFAKALAGRPAALRAEAEARRQSGSRARVEESEKRSRRV